jgi:hypothetical protein
MINAQGVALWHFLARGSGKNAQAWLAGYLNCGLGDPPMKKQVPFDLRSGQALAPEKALGMTSQRMVWTVTAFIVCPWLLSARRCLLVVVR